MSQVKPSESYLIWEEPLSQKWWLCRSRQDGILYIIVRDPLINYVLLLKEVDPLEEPIVISALPWGKENSLDAMVVKMKECLHTLNNVSNNSIAVPSVIYWRLRRIIFICAHESPLIFVAVLMGSFLAFLVSLFVVITDLQGWFMIAIGSFLGALMGVFLRWIANKKLVSFTGSWGRFFSTVFSATVSALLTTLLFFVLFAA